MGVEAQSSNVHVHVLHTVCSCINNSHATTVRLSLRASEAGKCSQSLWNCCDRFRLHAPTQTHAFASIAMDSLKLHVIVIRRTTTWRSDRLARPLSQFIHCCTPVLPTQRPPPVVTSIAVISTNNFSCVASRRYSQRSSRLLTLFLLEIYKIGNYCTFPCYYCLWVVILRRWILLRLQL